MYIGRSFEQLENVPLSDWKKSELEYYHFTLDQVHPLLTESGVKTYVEILKEIEKRGGLTRDEADWRHGTRVTFD